MPSRKSDQRKEDVTPARFVPVEDVSENQPSPPSKPKEAPASVPTETKLSEGSSSPKQDRKDKEKDPKSKDADKSNADKEGKDSVTVEDLALPKSIITRLAKGVLPPNTQIQANAILALTKSTTVFISYLATHANEHTVNANKKTIMPADVFQALEDTEFGFMKERLEAEFAKFNAVQTEKRTSYRQKVRAAKQDPSDADPGNDDVDMTDANASFAAENTTLAGDLNSEDRPRAKKARVDPNASVISTNADTEDEHGAGGDDEDDIEEDGEEQEDEDDGDEEEEEEEEEVDEDEEQEGAEGSGAETQDALEDREDGDETDEALDGDESD